MLKVVKNLGKPVFAIPQSAITPTKIYESSKQGVDMSSYAYDSSLEDCPPDDDWDVPLTSQRGVDVNDLYLSQRQIENRKAQISNDLKSRVSETRRIRSYVKSKYEK